MTFRLIRYRYHLRFARNYVGASYQSLRPDSSEHWCRGGDLKDGPLRALPSVLLSILMQEFQP